MQACLSALHTQLAITAAQEAAWQVFASAVAEQARGMLRFEQQVLQTPATVLQRATQFAQFMQQRADDAAAIAQALGGLYAVLSPGQQALFNGYFAWGG